MIYETIYTSEVEAAMARYGNAVSFESCFNVHAIHGNTFLSLCQDAIDSGAIVRRWWNANGEGIITTVQWFGGLVWLLCQLAFWLCKAGCEWVWEHRYQLGHNARCLIAWSALTCYDAGVAARQQCDRIAAVLQPYADAIVDAIAPIVVVGFSLSLIVASVIYWGGAIVLEGCAECFLPYDFGEYAA